MTQQIPDVAKAWLDGGEFATVATVLPGGQPQLSVVWVDRDGEDIVLSTLAGRRKHLNLQANPAATVLCYPKDNPYAYLEVRGTATITPDPDGALIEKLSQRYTGGPYTLDKPGDKRVVVRISADKVVVRG